MKIKSTYLSSPRIIKDKKKETEKRNGITLTLEQSWKQTRDRRYIAIESIAGVEEINRILPARALKRGRQTIYTKRVFTRGKAEEGACSASSASPNENCQGLINLR